jgi:hypothetical protein
MTSTNNTSTINDSTLNDYAKCGAFIDNAPNHISVKMITKRCNVSLKIAKRVLRNHPNTRLCPPHEYGSNKSVNYKLYKKITSEEMIEICNSELKGLLKNNIVREANIKSFIRSGFAYHMRTKYAVVVDNSIISKLSY